MTLWWTLDLPLLSLPPRTLKNSDDEFRSHYQSIYYYLEYGFHNSGCSVGWVGIFDCFIRIGPWTTDPKMNKKFDRKSRTMKSRICTFLGEQWSSDSDVETNANIIANVFFHSQFKDSGIRNVISIHVIRTKFTGSACVEIRNMSTNKSSYQNSLELSSSRYHSAVTKYNNTKKQFAKII